VSEPPASPRAASAAAKFLIRLAVAVGVGAVCVALVVKDMDGHATWAALRRVSLGTILLYLVTLSATHVFRVWRWEYLLRPIGVALPWRHLFLVSSAGFMAILALPVRLGEFVRPYFVVRLGQSRMSAVLGTIAVERIVDGLIISVIFFGSYLASGRGTWSPQLEVAAWLSLLGFLTAVLFLLSALRWTEPSIRIALAVSLLPRLAPRLAEKIADKLRALIQGFRVLHEPRNLVPFLLQSLLYWASNGLGMWLLAQGMGLPISPIAAYASMSFTGVIISLPNAPGLVGQFHLGVIKGLEPYVAAATLQSVGIAYALLVHGIQVLWYVALGFVSLVLMRRILVGRSSLRDVVVESGRAAAASEPVPASREVG
jgi:glycosyltransferase 2 family protein